MLRLFRLLWFDAYLRMLYPFIFIPKTLDQIMF